MADARIRHATETFVNNLIDSVKKLIKTNTDQINVLSGKIDIGILRSGTLADYILKHGRNGGVGGNTHEASMTDLPEQRWGMFHVMKHASEVWTVIWYSDYNSTHYKRQLRSEGWVTEWEPIATTSKTDILTSQLSNLWEVSGNRVSNISKVGNVVTFNLNFKCGTKGYGTAIYQVPQQFRLPQVTNLNGVGTNATGVKTLIDLFYDSGDGFIKVNSVTSDAVNISIAISINV